MIPLFTRSPSHTHIKHNAWINSIFSEQLLWNIPHLWGGQLHPCQIPSKNQIVQCYPDQCPQHFDLTLDDLKRCFLPIPEAPSVQKVNWSETSSRGKKKKQDPVAFRKSNFGTTITWDDRESLEPDTKSHTYKYYSSFLPIGIEFAL